MGAAASLFEEVRRKGVAAIHDWVEDIHREDLHLDFKRKSHPERAEPDEADKRNYSKALSGFANSDGGLIVWGVDAPSSGSGIRELFPIADASAFAEHLDSLASRLVVPSVEGVENLVVHESKESLAGYVISYIPPSTHSPHRAEHHSAKRYFQRIGDSFIQLEHWQLEYMFGRRQVPVLRVAWDIADVRSGAAGAVEDLLADKIMRRDKNVEEQHEAILRISVQNKGRAIAKYCCLRIRFKTSHDRYHFNGRFKHNLIDYGGFENATVKAGYTEVTARARPGLVVYPSDRLVFFEFRFSYSKKEANAGLLPEFILNFDLFAENIRGIIGRRLTIPAETINRILEN
jgi:hypothetical protein